MKIELSRDMCDELFTEVLKYYIVALQGDINRLQSLKNIGDYQKVDLINNIDYLKHLTKTAEYFGITID